MKLHLAVLAHEPETGLGAFAEQLKANDVSYEVLCTTAGVMPDYRSFDGTIALGGSLGVHDARLLAAHDWVRDAVLAGQPFLGVCLGGQLLASALDAHVACRRPEVGIHDVFLTDAADRDPLFGGLPARLPVFGWHEDTFDLPRGAVPLAGSIRCTYQAFRFGPAAYGLQFHPERFASTSSDAGATSPATALLRRAAPAVTSTNSRCAVRRATPALDVLAGELLGRWLYLVGGVAALTSARVIAA